MRKKKIDVPEYIDTNRMVSLKSMGNICEIGIYDRFNSAATILPISKEEYILLSTGEIKKVNHHANDRTENLRNLEKTMHQLSDLINANITTENVMRCRFITLTYKENMQDSNQLYKDFRDFNKRLKRFLQKSNNEYEYIVTVEAQGRGAFHLHLILIFNREAPFIENRLLFEIWGKGFVSIKAIDKNIDNIGKYLTSYLTDLPINEEEGILMETLGGDIKEVRIDNCDKKVIKGARLKLLPAGIRIYRYSKGIKKPEIKKVTYKTALQEMKDKGYTKVNEYAVELFDEERDFVSKYIKETYKKHINTTLD